MATAAELRKLLADHAPDGESLDRLVRYGELLERWSATHNLVRYSTSRELVDRHIAEALVALQFMAPQGRVIDVGSGAGLPGVPLLACLPGWRGILVEPRRKRWTFLRLVVRELALDAVVEPQRYQELVHRRGFDMVCARGLGGHEDLLSWARTKLTATGQVAIWTTEAGASALAAASGWRVLSCALPDLEHGMLVRLRPCST